MKYKKFAIFITSVLVILCIYKITNYNKVNYTALGDGIAKGKTPFDKIGLSYTDYFHQFLKNKYITNSDYKQFSYEDCRITDLINKIDSVLISKEDSKQNNITQAIKQADIITLSVGSDELFYKLKQNKKNIENNKISKELKYIDEIFKDYELLISKIRNITKKPIILIGYYNPLNIKNVNAVDKIYDYLDLKFNNLIDDNIYYISLYDDFQKNKRYLPNNNIVFPSLEGYNYISNRIINVVKKNILK